MKFFKKYMLQLFLIVVILIGLNSRLNAQLSPNLVYPADKDSCIHLENIVFVWDTVPDADRYRIQVSSSSTWTTPDLADSWVTHPTSTFTLSVPDNYTTYYWRVSASFTETSQEHFSEIYEFTTIGVPPNLLSPDNNDICVELNPKFEWSKVEYASSYHLQIAYSTTFTGQQIVYDNSSITSNTITVNLPNYFDNYYWRVATNYGECTTDWSEPYLFSTKQSHPVGIFPKDDSVGLPLDITLEWSEIDPNATYSVEVATDANFENMLVSHYGISETSTTLPHLAYNTDYFWRLKSYIRL